MALTYNLGRIRTASTGNPITFTYEVLPGVGLIVLLLNVPGAAVRGGGSPTLGSTTLTQRNSTQRAAASPEASAELWDVVNPVPGTYTFTIPNTGGLSVKATVVEARGGKVVFVTANGGNNTSSNPSPGTVVATDPGITVAVTAGGWQTWNPSAQGGTIIANTDDGATGGGEQYTLNTLPGSVTLFWTFATSEDWGAVTATYRELPSNRMNNYMRPGGHGGISVGDLG
jgi:hypothetical protein